MTRNEIITAFAHEKPVFRILVNTTSSQGAIGLTTALTPSLTLSTGSWGGGIHSDNISAYHLLNIKRVAYETDPINQTESGYSGFKNGISDIDQNGKITKEQVEYLVRKVVKQLGLENK